MIGRRKDAHSTSLNEVPDDVGRFRSEESRAQFLELLDAALATWPTHSNEAVETSFGTTVCSTISTTETYSAPVVLLQGGNSTVAGWSHLIGLWSKHHPVVVIDTVWEAGRSTQHTPITNGEQASQWLDEVFDGLGLSRVHLVGYSYGAWAALNQAVLRPQRLATVTAIEPPGAITGIPLRTWARMLRLMRGNPDEALDFLAWVRNGKPPPSPIKELLLSAQTQFLKKGSPLPRKLRADEWKNITVPLQIILAGSSQFIPHRAQRILQRHAPAAAVSVLDGIGHAVLSDAPEATAQLVEEFVVGFDRQ